MVVHPGLGHSVSLYYLDAGRHEDVIEGTGADGVGGLVNDSVEGAEASRICRLKADLLESCKLFLVEKSFADTVSNKQYIISDGGHINAESGYLEFASSSSSAT